MGKIDKYRWWLTPKYPRIYIERILSYRPEGIGSQFRNLIRTWVVHPIKRRLAKYYLLLLRRFFGLKVVGITGSTGKTTTKEMLASILKLEGNTVYSYANIDPVFNIPTTILRCNPSTKYLVLEMGVEYPGDMDFYLWLARPDVGIITNIYPSHTLYFGNLDGVYREKSKLIKGVLKGGTLILNSENRHLQQIGLKKDRKYVWFGGDSFVSASDIKYTSRFGTEFNLRIGEVTSKVVLPVLGKQFVENALAAAGAAYFFDISLKKIKRGIERFKPQVHRMAAKKLKSGAILIDDSYNNNPEAAKKSIALLKEFAGKRKTMLVFGDMLELGTDEVKYHNEIGNFVRSKKIDYVIGVGPLSKNVVTDKKYWADNWEKAVPIVKEILTGDMVVLVKGSRSINLDKLAEQLK